MYGKILNLFIGFVEAFVSNFGKQGILLLPHCEGKFIAWILVGISACVCVYSVTVYGVCTCTCIHACLVHTHIHTHAHIHTYKMYTHAV